jgi:hypothetical protein
MRRSCSRLFVLAALAVACDTGASKPPPSTAQPQPQPTSQPPQPIAPLPTPASGGPLDILVVDWPATDRSDLELMLVEGRSILVASDGRRTTLQPGCNGRRGGTAYTFKGHKPQAERVLVHSDTFDATIVGTWVASAVPRTLGELDGDCDRVTHVVHAMTVGAFELTSSTSSNVSAEVPVAGGVVGGSSSSSTSRTSRSGDLSTCAAATDRRPSPSCNAVVRLSLTVITR